MLHIKKEQRRMHKQVMKESIGPPPQLQLSPGSYQQQQYIKQSYQQTYGEPYNNDNANHLIRGVASGPGQGQIQGVQNQGLLGVNQIGQYDQRAQRRSGFDPRSPLFNRPVIGSEYEPQQQSQVSNVADIDYQLHLRRHQQELQTQELMREEYRMRNRQAERQAERRQMPPHQGNFLPQNLPLGLPQGRGHQRSPEPGPMNPQQQYQRSMSGQAQIQGVGGQGVGVGVFQQQQAQERLRMSGMVHRDQPIDGYDFPLSGNNSGNGSGNMTPGNRYNQPTSFGSTSSMNNMSKVNDTLRSQSQPPLTSSAMFDPEFEQSMRSLSLQNNDMLQQGQILNQGMGQGQNGQWMPYSHRENERRPHLLDGQRRLSSRDSSPGLRSLESSTHGPQSLESSTHGPRSHESSVDDYSRSRVGSVDGLGINVKATSSPIIEGFGSYFPGGLGAVGSSSPARPMTIMSGSGSGSHSHSSMMNSMVSSGHSHQSTVISSRTSSVSNEEDCRGILLTDRALASAASLVLNEFSDYSPSTTEDQKRRLSEQLFPLIESFKPFLAGSITDYLVNNAARNELLQVLETPDLLLPHYIAVALSKMNATKSNSP